MKPNQANLIPKQLKTVLIAAVLFTMAGVGCAKKSSDAGATATVPPAANSPTTVPAKPAQAASPVLGTPAYNLTYVNRTVKIDGTAAIKIDDARIKESPGLENALIQLSKINKAVETEEGSVEFFAGKDLVLLLKVTPAPATVIWSKLPLQLKAVTYTRAARASALFAFDNAECAAAVKGCHGVEMRIDFHPTAVKAAGKKVPGPARH